MYNVYDHVQNAVLETYHNYLAFVHAGEAWAIRL